jgi:hypothetical protein
MYFYVIGVEEWGQGKTAGYRSGSRSGLSRAHPIRKEDKGRGKRGPLEGKMNAFVWATPARRTGVSALHERAMRGREAALSLPRLKRLETWGTRHLRQSKKRPFPHPNVEKHDVRMGHPTV